MPKLIREVKFERPDSYGAIYQSESGLATDIIYVNDLPSDYEGDYGTIQRSQILIGNGLELSIRSYEFSDGKVRKIFDQDINVPESITTMRRELEDGGRLELTISDLKNKFSPLILSNPNLEKYRHIFEEIL